MLHARVVRPRGQGGVTSAEPLPGERRRELDQAHPGRPGRPGRRTSSAVVAPKEYDAIQAAGQLKVVWKSDPKLPGSGNFWSYVRRRATRTRRTRPATRPWSGNVDCALASAAKTISATYKYQYNGHMSIGPTCAVADVKANSADDLLQLAGSVRACPTTLAGFQLNGQPYFGLQPAGDPLRSSTRARARSARTARAARDDVLHRRGGHLEGRRRAGAAPVDALGRARLGCLRPAAMYDVKAGIDASGNIDRARLDVLRPGRHLADDDERARRLRHLAGRRSGNGGPARRTRSTRCRRPPSACSPRPSRSTAAHSRATRCAPRARRSRTSPASSSSTSSPTPRGWIRSRSAGSNIDGSTIVRPALARQCWTQPPRCPAGSRRSPRRTSSQGNVGTGRGFGFGTFANTQVGHGRGHRGEQEVGQDRREAISTSPTRTASR